MRDWLIWPLDATVASREHCQMPQCGCVPLPCGLQDGSFVSPMPTCPSCSFANLIIGWEAQAHKVHRQRLPCLEEWFKITRSFKTLSPDVPQGVCPCLYKRQRCSLKASSSPALKTLCRIGRHIEDRSKGGPTGCWANNGDGCSL